MASEARAGSSPALALGWLCGVWEGWRDITVRKSTVWLQWWMKGRNTHQGKAFYFPWFHSTDGTEQHHRDTRGCDQVCRTGAGHGSVGLGGHGPCSWASSRAALGHPLSLARQWWQSGDLRAQPSRAPACEDDGGITWLLLGGMLPSQTGSGTSGDMGLLGMGTPRAQPGLAELDSRLQPSTAAGRGDRLGTHWVPAHQAEMLSTQGCCILLALGS